MTSPLAQRLTFPCGSVLRNRIAKSAMTEGLADPFDNPTKAHNTLYGTWDDGGLGLQITGNVMIDRRFLERSGNVVVEDEQALDALTAWAAAGHSTDGQIWMQISHPGRQCQKLVNTRPMAPSAVQLKLMGLFGNPRAMTEADIVDVIARYANTARIAKMAGFDGVQIHGAHGYLISQFLSSVTNQRQDKWGGNVANRARFLREVIASVRNEVGKDYPVSVKLNSADFQKGGFSQDECKMVAGWLSDDGIDLLEISGGTYEHLSMLNGPNTEGQRESMRKREAYFVEYAKNIRDAVEVPLMVTGGFRSLASMEAAVERDGIDVIGLARPVCTAPDLANDLLNGSVQELDSYEEQLVLGSGLLGVNTPILPIKAINAFGSLGFFYWQIIRLSQGLQPDKRIRLVSHFLRHMKNDFRLNRLRKKAMKTGQLNGSGSAKISQIANKPNANVQPSSATGNLLARLYDMAFHTPDEFDGELSRALILMRLAVVVGVVFHAIILAIAYKLSIDALFYLNLISVPAYFIGMIAVWKYNSLFYPYILLTNFEAPVHALISTLSIGLESGLFLFALVPAAGVLFLPFFKWRVRIYLSLINILVFSIIGVVGVIHDQWYELYVGWQVSLMIFSTLGTGALVAMLIGINQWVAVSAEAALEIEYDRSETLLRNILPDPIAERLKDKPGETIADGHEAVTALFADIVDFTPIANEQSPEKVVQLLNRIFSEFDGLAKNHGLEKIKTVGDAYFVVAGIPELHANGPVAIADFALSLMEAARKLSNELEQEIRLRIGIDTGEAVAGVIGTQKFAYDIWGDTINTAARMESAGVPDRIQVTENFKNALHNKYVFTERGVVDVKGKGPLRLFFLECPRESQTEV